MRALASVAIDHEEEVHLYTDVVRGHHETNKRIGGGMRVSLCCRATPASRSSKFCFSLVQFTNRDVSSLLALLKAIIVFVRFMILTDTYLSNEINAALE